MGWMENGYGSSPPSSMAAPKIRHAVNSSHQQNGCELSYLSSGVRGGAQQKVCSSYFMRTLYVIVVTSNAAARAEGWGGGGTKD